MKFALIKLIKVGPEISAENSVTYATVSYLFVFAQSMLKLLCRLDIPGRLVKMNKVGNFWDFLLGFLHTKHF